MGILNIEPLYKAFLPLIRLQTFLQNLSNTYLKQIEREFVRWMPQSNKKPITLFRLLRDQTAKKARRKSWFTPQSVRELLSGNSGNTVFCFGLTSTPANI